MSDWDGLRLCSVCGDRETQGDVCWVCWQQEMIDNDELSDAPLTPQPDEDAEDQAAWLKYQRGDGQ